MNRQRAALALLALLLTAPCCRRGAGENGATTPAPAARVSARPAVREEDAAALAARLSGRAARTRETDEVARNIASAFALPGGAWIDSATDLLQGPVRMDFESMRAVLETLLETPGLEPRAVDMCLQMILGGWLVCHPTQESCRSALALLDAVLPGVEEKGASTRLAAQSVLQEIAKLYPDLVAPWFLQNVGLFADSRADGFRAHLIHLTAEHPDRALALMDQLQPENRETMGKALAEAAAEYHNLPETLAALAVWQSSATDPEAVAGLRSGFFHGIAEPLARQPRQVAEDLLASGVFSAEDQQAIVAAIPLTWAAMDRGDPFCSGLDAGRACPGNAGVGKRRCGMDRLAIPESAAGPARCEAP